MKERKFYKNTCLIQLGIGSKVSHEDGRMGTIIDVKLSPNGIDNPNLVAILFVQLENGNKLSATSNRFKPVEDESYEELNPTVHLINL